MDERELMERREARRQCLEVSHCNPVDPSLPPFEINRRPLTPDLILTREQLARAYRPKFVVFNGKKIPAGTVANYIAHRPPHFPLKPREESTGKDLNPSLAAATTTGTNAEVGGGSKGPAADPSEPVGIKAEGMHNYPLKSQPSTESLVIDLNPAPAGTASTAGTNAEVQGGSLLKRPCEVLGESSEILREVKKQMASALSAASNNKIHSYCC